MSKASRSSETKQVAGKYRHKRRSTMHRNSSSTTVTGGDVVSSGNNSVASAGDVNISRVYVNRDELLESIRSKAQTLPDGPI